MTQTIKPFNNGTWTPARYRSFITSALRRVTPRWGPRALAKRMARNPFKLPNEKGRYVFHSKCASCSKLVPETQSKVDHIKPVVDPNVGFQTWDDYIERMFCEVDNFQVLCIPCHTEKTREERKIATERKRRERVQT